ncbi:MAG: PAS domain S-box protein, partial [Bacteroidales bacterium]|nr:PAS domain S-box protein [Bacteroidales bacterium]
MKLKDLLTINQNPEFRNSRLANQKNILLMLTIGGSVLVIMWQFLDSFYLKSSDTRLLWLRMITVVVYNLNLLVAFYRKKPKAIKQHMIAGFYFGSIFYTFLAIYTGASQSPYWFGLFFNIIAWFVLMPYSFSEMIAHSFAFIIIYISGQYIQREYEVVNFEMAKITFLFAGTLFVSFLGTYISNKLDAENFMIRKALKEKNDEYLAINEDLINEIEKHQITANQLAENQRFLDNILSNAPIIIWSIDLEGKYTYSQYKGESGLEPHARIGKSALEVYKGTKIENFLKKVLGEELRNEILKVGEIYYDTRVSPIYNTDGEKIGFMGVSLDITERIKVENELRKFSQVLDQAPGAVFIIDKNSNFEYVNPEFSRISGYSKSDLLYKNINDTLYSGNIPESRKSIVETLVSGKKWQGELLTINKNGSSYWANTTASPYKDENEHIAGYIVIQQDITEKKKMEEALQLSEERYRMLVENSQDGICIVQGGKFKFVNKALCRMLGYTNEEIYNMPGLNIFHSSEHEKISMVYENKVEGRFLSRNYTFQMLAKDGNIVEVEAQTSSYNFEGKPAGFLTLRNITHSKKIQQALRESEKKYRELTEMLPQTVYELDLQGQITYMNQTGFSKLGVDQSDYGTSAFQFILPEQHDKMRTNMKRSIEENYYTPGNEYTIVKKNGERAPVMIFAAPMIVDGKITGTRGIILDMSEHEAMKKALRESEEKYRTLIEKAEDGIIITQQGHFKFVNRAFCQMMQYSENELIDKPFLDFVSSEDHAIMQHYNKRRIAGEDFQVMYRSKIKRKDGKYLHIELNTRTSQFDGKPAAFIITRDITDRLKTEEELRVAKEKLEVLNNNLENRIQESSQKLIEANTQLIRLQKENLQSQFEVLRQQVNPHFLFNSLNTLSSLMYHNVDAAAKYIRQLSQVYRYVLENSNNELVTLK